MVNKKVLNERELDRVIEMAWEDRTPFEAIFYQFNLTEKEVIITMRTNLKTSSFKRWRKRVNSGVSKKHLKKRNPEINRLSVLVKRLYLEIKLVNADHYLLEFTLR
jgi:uncharacterized protein (TIGR03643 family)